MRHVGYTLLLAGLAFGLIVFQSLLPSLLSNHPWTVDVVIPIVVALGINRSLQLPYGAVVVLILGALVDLSAGLSPSAHTFVLMCVLLMARLLTYRVSLGSWPARLGVTFGLSVVAGLIMWVSRGLFGPVGFAVNLADALAFVSKSAVATTAFAPVVLAIAFPIVQAMGPVRERGVL